MQGVQVLLLSSARDSRTANVVARHLKAAGLEVSVEPIEAAAGAPTAVGSAGAIAVLFGRASDPAPYRRLAAAIRPDQRPYLVLLEGALTEAIPELNEAFGRGLVFDLTGGLGDAALADLASRVREDLLPSEEAPFVAPWEQNAAALEPPRSEVPEPAPAPRGKTSARQTAATKTAPAKAAKTAPPPSTSDEASGPSRELDQALFERMSPSSKQALADAAHLAGLVGSDRIHMDHLLVGLYRKPGGPMQQMLARLHPPMSADDLAALLEDVVEAVLPPDEARAPLLTSPPRLSGHAREAIDGAVAIAGTHPIPGGGARPIQSRHLLYGALAVADCTVIEALIARGARRDAIDLSEAATPGADGTAAIAGFRSDEALGRDLLDIRREVEALAKVIAARDVHPPLAIGLFGDWGTGKTFFMRQMRERIDEIAAAEQARLDGRAPVYNTEIVQLEFNAWHYIEQDLWASLASAIFDGLDDALTRRGVAVKKQERTDFDRAQLLTSRAKALQELERAEQEKAEADTNLVAASTRLERLDTMYDEIARGIGPRDLLAGAMSVAAADPAVTNQFEIASKRVDDSVKAVASTIGVTPENLRGELERSGSLRAWLAGATKQLFLGTRVWLPIAAAALVGIAAFVIVTSVLAGSELVGVLAGAVGVLVGAAAPVLYAAGRVWNVIRAARAEGLRAIEHEREERRQVLVAEQQREASRSLDAETRVDQARSQLKQADAKLEASKPKRMLANFVSGRRASADYRARLGVVAQARGDFEQLSNLLRLAQEDRTDGTHAAKPEATDGAPAAAEEEFLPTIERIVLYIDDLDRCKEKEVVAVLQAVNLLLAFPLFVVVVAVDPRWLVHSLRVESRAFEGGRMRDGVGSELIDTEAEAEWQATPLNYLEKIFQVPFAIKPMGEGGFKAMIEDLVGPAGGASGENGTSHVAAASRTEGATGARDAATNGTGAAATPQPVPAPTTDGPAQRASQPMTAPLAAPPPRRVDLDPGFLRISDGEQKFMNLLHPLVTTPRAAKRFVNVYRILKASATADRRTEMAGEDQYRAILLLLAMLTGHPSETTVLLRKLIEERPPGDWWDFIEPEIEGAIDPDATSVDARLESDRWKVLRDRLRRVKPAYANALCAPFLNWGFDVARFSFESSRVLVGQPERPAARHEPGEAEAAQAPVP